MSADDPDSGGARAPSVTELFLRVADLAPDDRRSVLDRECRDDPGLRRAVEELLSHDRTTGALRDRLAPAEAARAEDDEIPDRIGPFRVCGLLGAGGMGRVYDAMQDRPIARRVAIKVVRPSLSTERVLARFAFEQETLARMDHPNVARILDAGTTADGAPYFAMEFVDGEQLGRYCDDRGLGVDARLELFEAICAGVEHAHQRGVIHRDLKPGNVLVSEFDGRAVPKIIDFGIARAIEAPGTTRLDERPGTPGYMSPEQQDPSGGPIDTRTDVFSLGVLLYELLTGRTPPPGVSSDDPAWIEPSRCRADDRALLRRLRGDLDWIVWRAVRRRSDDRYPSAAALAADVRRHRERLPVEAHPARPGYLLRRFVQRHRAAVALVTLAIVALGAFAGASALQAERVRRERDSVRRMLGYLTRMFADVDPQLTRGRSPTAEEMLDRGAHSLDELDDDPRTRAWLQATLGRVYARLGSFDKAEPLLVEAVATQRDVLAPDDPERAHALNDLGALYVDTARYTDARPLLEQALELRRAGGNDGRSAVAQSLNELGRLAWETGDIDETEARYRDALALHEALGGASSYDVAVDLINVSNPVNRRGRFDDGEALLRRALAILDAAHLGNDLHLADCLNNLGIIARRTGDARQAIEYLERATRIRRAALGDDHPDVALSLTNLGSAYWSLGDLDQARRCFEEGLAIRERVLPPDHPHIAFSINALAVVHKNLGDYDEARRLFERGLAIARGKLGDAHPDVARILGNLGNLEREVGHPDVARGNYEQALEIYRAAQGEEHPDVARILHALGVLDLSIGDLASAESGLSSALRIRQAGLGDRHPSVAETLTALGTCHRRLGRVDLARPELERALSIVEEARGDEHPETAETLEALGELLVEQGDEAKGRDLLRRADEIRRALSRPDALSRTPR